MQCLRFFDICGNSCDIMSKVDLENWFSSHNSSLGMFSSVALKGRVKGRSGSNVI